MKHHQNKLHKRSFFHSLRAQLTQMSTSWGRQARSFTRVSSSSQLRQFTAMSFGKLSSHSNTSPRRRLAAENELASKSAQSGCRKTMIRETARSKKSKHRCLLSLNRFLVRQSPYRREVQQFRSVPRNKRVMWDGGGGQKQSIENSHPAIHAR